MIVQTQGNIFLADYRGCTQSENFRSFHTFNYGAYFDKNREPFGILQTVNDETLKEQNSITRTIEKDIEIVLIPIVGTLQYSDSEGKNAFIEVGVIQKVPLKKGAQYALSNPYSDALINYLYLELKMPFENFDDTIPSKRIDLTQKNQLQAIFSTNNAQTEGYIGIYDGREEGIYTLNNPQNGIFACVIAGVFEVQNRLLHERDSLTLWDLEEVEFEALSNDAVILLFEIPI